MKYPTKYQLRDAKRKAWDEEQERRIAQEREEEREKEQKFANVVDAVEAFVEAKISYAKRYAGSSEGWSPSTRDVDETREQLTDKLRELVKL